MNRRERFVKTDKLWISDTVRRNSDVNEILREFAEENRIEGKDFNHLCLLAEETLGMVSQMLNVYDGQLWLEGTAAGYEIILEADVHESHDGKRMPVTAPEGFMAKVAVMMNCSYMFESIAEMPEDLAGMLPDYMSYGMRGSKESPAWAGRWSLSAYRCQLMNSRKEKSAARLALEELEKSIVAQLADEVTIGIHGHRIRLVITKYTHEAV